jgi:hypothetical protein
VAGSGTVAGSGSGSVAGGVAGTVAGSGAGSGGGSGCGYPFGGGGASTPYYPRKTAENSAEFCGFFLPVFMAFLGLFCAKNGCYYS